ncbi:MAG: Proposed lipoate regulatory protein YbeD [uncultured Sulfurovum sp.]|uniref:Proposed lipoate regulatory protein YbeD n=1 Tax=uncultured Sulfurovum sp. TaxID=269237 RepID=A0A6S6TZR7_9BACT|nr:MAG: Proposed lipoate regulatory protein YbeD [uncultured Sulfurovum sp.]
MILDGNSCERPDIEYPCEWGYKVIGTDKGKLEACIFDIVGERAYKTKGGNTSSKGKFHSLNMTCKVASQADRDAIFKAFSDHKDVKMVI